MEEDRLIDNKSLWEKTASEETIVLDTRIMKEYADAHIPGSLLAPFHRYGWGKTVADYLREEQREMAIVASNEAIATAAKEELVKNGINVSAVISDALQKWKQENLPVASVSDIDVENLHENIGEFQVIDVREPYEWRSGVVPSALKIPMGELMNKLAELPKDRKYAVICATGSRSQSAAIFMADNGFNALNVVGGMSRWLSLSLPVDFQ